MGLVGLFMLFLAQGAFAVLPDSLTVNVGDLDGDSITDSLVLTKRSLRTSNLYRVRTWDSANGYVTVASPEVRTYRGYVDNDLSMRVNATIMPGDVLQANLSDGRNINIRIRDLQIDTSAMPSGTVDPGTGNVVVPLTVDRQNPTSGGYMVPTVLMRRTLLGIDCQSDTFATNFNSSVDEAVANAEQRVNDTDSYWMRDVGVAFEITEIIIRLEVPAEGWGDYWNNVTTYPWNTRLNMEAGGGGGSSGTIMGMNEMVTIGSSASAFGSGAWGHEMGHGLGLGHQHWFNDNMSGSRSCFGVGTVQQAVDNIDQQATASTMPEVTVNIDIAPYAMEDFVTTQQDLPITIDVLDNDYDNNGDTISLSYVDAATEKGGTVSINANQAYYTPPAGFIGRDTFTYHVSDATGIANRTGLVSINVHGSDALISHYLLDETSGKVAHDSGLWQAHGQLYAGLSFDTGSVAGKIGNALENSSLPGEAQTEGITFGQVGDPFENDFAVSLWVKYNTLPDPLEEEWGIIGKGSNVGPNYSHNGNAQGGWGISNVGTEGFRFNGNVLRHKNQNLSTSEVFDRKTTTLGLQTGTWYHLAMTLDRDNHLIRAWVNNVEVTGSEFGTTVPDGVIAGYLPLVTHNLTDRDTSGACVIDDVRIYNKVFSPADVADLYQNSPSADIAAGVISPKRGQINALPGLPLRWVPGLIAPAYPSFNVYFGTNESAVANATTASLEYMGSFTETEYTPSTVAGTWYYWRVDEVKEDSSVIPGSTIGFFTGGTTLNDPPLLNPSFEEPYTTTYVPDLVGWYQTQTYYHFSTVYEGQPNVPATPYGRNWGMMGSIRQATQFIGYWTPNTDYRINILLGHKTINNHTVSLLIGGVPEALSIDHLLLDELDEVASGTLPWGADEDDTYESEVILNTGTGHHIGEPMYFRFENNGDIHFDNVRIAPASDSAAPTPDPMTFATAPHAISTDSVNMMATTAYDPSGVEYYFTCTAGGGNDSGWQNNTTYEDTGLTPDTQYTYTVTARDKSIAQNTTAASTGASVTTYRGGPPTFTIDPTLEADATEEAAYSSTIADDATDPDSDPLTFSKLGGPSWLSVATDGALSGTPANADVGVNAFTVEVNDDKGGTDQATLNITVINVNDAPTFTTNLIVEANAQEGFAYSSTIGDYATDPDVGDTLTFSKVSGPIWLSVATDGALSGTPGAGDLGLNSFTVEVNDGNGGTDQATLEITVDEFVAPIAHWKFDDGSGGTAVDTMGNADGTISGASWTTGYSSGGLQFDGVDDEVDCGTGASLGGQTNFTIMAWIKTSAAGGNQLIIQQRNGGYNGEYQFQVNSSGGLYFMVYGNSAYQWQLNTAAIVNDGQWHFVAAVRDGANGYIYIDGNTTAAASGTGTIRDLNPGISVGIGRDIRDNNTQFNGTIDEVRIYNWALSGQDLANVHSSYTGSGNTAPVFTVDPITKTNATEDVAYGDTIAGSATDADSDPLTYSKVSGPAWLNVAADGTLSGTPTSANLGLNSFVVDVTDGISGVVQAALEITVAFELSTISINFDRGGSEAFSGGALIGPLATDSTYWNAASDSAGTLNNLVDSSGAATGVNVQWNSQNTGANNDGTADDEHKLAVGYLDDGDTGSGDAVIVTLSNIPYANYRVYGLFATDQNSSGSCGIVNVDVNGTWALGGSASTTALAWGGITANHTANDEYWTQIEPGSTQGNYWTVVTTGATCTVTGQNRSDSNRGCLTAVIIEKLQDTDGDGIPNDVDDDDDNDGIPDDWETARGLDPLVDDASGHSDSDRYDNWFEYVSDTDPLDGNSWQTFVMKINPGTGDPTARFSTSTSRLYTMRYRTNPVDGVWADLGIPFLGTGTETNIPDPAAGSQRYYRLRIELP
jgi:hypothetical protein